MTNIALIGMPGCGKSTVGVILAKVTKHKFVDTDLVIQEAHDRTLAELIAERGIDGFLQLENEIVAALTPQRSVIATGGSVIYGAEAMAALARHSRIVYLRHRFEVIDSRLTNIRGRGVTLREGQTLLDLYRERIPLYERYAQLTVDADGLTVEQTAQVIVERLTEKWPEDE